MPNTYTNKGVFTSGEDDIEISEKHQNILDQLDDDEVSNESTELDDDAMQNLLCPNCATVMQEAEDLKLRTIAEMDNFKKRMQREKEEQVKYASENVLQDIIPALDNLDLALQYANNDACKDILFGIQMTRKLLLDSLKNHGLETISEENIPFDPEVHEAVGQEENPDLPENHVSKLLQKGYMLKDRLLRPAKVIVSK